MIQEIKKKENSENNTFCLFFGEKGKKRLKQDKKEDVSQKHRWHFLKTNHHTFQPSVLYYCPAFSMKWEEPEWKGEIHWRDAASINKSVL